MHVGRWARSIPGVSLDWIPLSHVIYLESFLVTGPPIHVQKPAVFQGNTHDRWSIVRRTWLPRSDDGHVQHECEARLCSIKCQLCKRLCSNQDHMHGLEAGATHLCGWVLSVDFARLNLMVCVAKITRALPSVLLRAYVRSRQRHIPFKPHSQVGTRHSCTLR